MFDDEQLKIMAEFKKDHPNQSKEINEFMHKLTELIIESSNLSKKYNDPNFRTFLDFGICYIHSLITDHNELAGLLLNYILKHKDEIPSFTNENLIKCSDIIQ